MSHSSSYIFLLQTLSIYSELSALLSAFLLLLAVITHMKIQETFEENENQPSKLTNYILPLRNTIQPSPASSIPEEDKQGLK